MSNILTVEGEKHDLEAMTRDDLLQLKSQIDDRRAGIDSQIADAKTKVHTEGQYADPDWYGRANHAAKRMGRQSQKIQIELARKKGLQKERNKSEVPISQYFLDVAREELDPEDLREMMQEARRRRDLAREKSDG
jgi:hypothetical protein